MRTTVRIDDQLLRDAKAHAARSGRSLNEVIEDALRAALTRRRGDANSPRPELLTFVGSELQPGVDLDDSATLLDVMEGADR